METGRPDFDMVVRRHGGALARFAWGYVNNAADHADLLQEILVALWQALPRFRGDASVWTFTFRVAHNRAVSFLTRSRRAAALPIPEQVRDPRPGPDALAERAVLRDRRGPGHQREQRLGPPEPGPAGPSRPAGRTGVR